MPPGVVAAPARTKLFGRLFLSDNFLKLLSREELKLAAVATARLGEIIHVCFRLLVRTDKEKNIQRRSFPQ